MSAWRHWHGRRRRRWDRTVASRQPWAQASGPRNPGKSSPSKPNANRPLFDMFSNPRKALLTQAHATRCVAGRRAADDRCIMPQHDCDRSLNMALVTPFCHARNSNLRILTPTMPPNITPLHIPMHPPQDPKIYMPCDHWHSAAQIHCPGLRATCARQRPFENTRHSTCDTS